MRIRGAKTELEEAGLETEGMVESTAKLREEILALSGVDIMEDANTFKSTYKIMDELAAKWENLTDIQQASITELIAGKRQGNIVSSLMSNFDTARQALDTSMNSAGSAMAEHEKWMQSVEASVNKVKAAWQSLSQSFLKSDFLTGLLNGVSSLADGLSKLMDTFGTLPTLATLFMGGMSLFNKGGFFKVARDELTGFATGITTTFGQVAKSVNASLSSINLNNGFIKTLNPADITAIQNYANAVKSGTTDIATLNTYMADASDVAMSYVQNTDAASVSVDNFAKYQQAAEVSTLAQNKSLGSARVLMKEYHSATEATGNVCKTTGMAQQDFANAVKQTNPALATAMTSTSSASSGMVKYTASLIGAKVASFGLQIAVTALNMTLTMGIGLLVSGLFSAISKVINRKKELAEKVDEITSKFKEQHSELQKVKGDFDTTNVDSMISKYERLAKGVDEFGNNLSLTASEYAEYQEISNSIADQVPTLIKGYDAQGNAILNYTGNIKDLIAAYEELIKTQNDSVLKPDAYEDIEEDFKNAMKDANSADGGLFKVKATLNEINALEALLRSDNLNELIPKLNEKYGANFSYLINELENAGIDKMKVGESYNEFLNRALTQNRDIVQRVVNDFNANLDAETEGMRSAAQAALSNAFDFSDSKYKNIGDKTQSLIRQIVGNFDAEQFDKITDSGKTVEEYINGMIDSFKNMSKGEATQLETAFDLQTKFNGGDISYGEYVQGIKNAEKLIDGLNLDEEVKNQIKLTLDTEEVQNEYDALKERFEEYDIQMKTEEAEKLLDSLTSSEYKVAVDLIAGEDIDFSSFKNIEALRKYIEEQAALLDAKNFTISMDVETESFEAVNAAIQESVSGAGLSSEAIDALRSRYSELESEGYNLSAMFEETANGIHLNREAVSELEQKLASDKLSETKGHLEVLKNRYDELTKEIDECTDAGDRASLYTERNSIIDKINDLATLASQYEGLTSAYNAWLTAEESGSERDMYEKIIEGFENIDDELSRGWIDDGTIKFLELLSGENLSTAGIEKQREAYERLGETIDNTSYSVRDFFTVNDDGNSTNAGVYNFLDAISQLQKEKFGTEDIIKKEDGNIVGFDFELVAKKDENGNVIKNGDQVIAEALGISEELVQIMLRAADDAGFVVNLEGAYTQLADLKTEAEAARDTLISLKKNGLEELKATDVNFKLNVEGQDLVDEQAKAVKLLDKFKKDGKIDLEMEGAQQALDIAEYLTIKLDDLTEPKFMQIDTSEVDENLRSPIEKIQEIGNLCKEKHLVTLTGDTEELNEVQDEINKVAKEIEELDPEIKAKIGIEENWDANTIANKIEKGELEIPAELKLDVQMSESLKDMRLMMMKQLGLVSDNEVKLKLGYDIDDSTVDNLIKDGKEEVVIEFITENEGWFEELSEKEKEITIDLIADGVDLDTLTDDEKKEVAIEFIAENEDEFNKLTEEEKEVVVDLVADDSALESLESHQVEIEAFARIFGVEEVDDLKEKLDGLTDEQIMVLAEVFGRMDVEKLKTTVSELDDKTIEAIAKAMGEGDVDSLKTTINGLDSKTVQAIAEAFGYSGVDELNTAIDNLNPKTVQAIAEALGITDVDSLKAAIDRLKDKDVSAVANVSGKSEVDGLKSAIDNLRGKTVTVWAEIKQKASSLWSSLTGGGGVDGTAHANGTAFIEGTTGRAFKQGNWGTKDSGVALGGEEAPELLVRNGRWHLIGEKGAEFFGYKKGDIIFNASQTKEIFEKGKITHGNGRGRALVSGTAFYGGSSGLGGWGKAGGNSVTTKKETTTTTTTTTKKETTTTTSSGSSSSSKPSSTSASTSSSSSSSSSEAKDDFEETIDWVETAISRIERAVDKLDKKANNVYKNWSERNKALSSEIGKVREEIELQEDAAERYLQEANSVGLDSSYAEKVRNGTIDIQDFKGESNEELVEKIKKYQEWYEKYLDCIDAAEELREQESKLYAQRFENIQSQYDGILQGYEHTESMLNEYISQSEAQGHIISKKYYQALISNEKQNISELKKEQSALIAERDKAVADNKIEKYSEDWYNMCAEIDGVTQAIEEGTTALIEYNNAMRDIDWEKFDLIQERISDVTAESEFLIELMSNDKLFDDKGKLTGQGAATMGLHALNYNTAMYQSDDYGKEIASLNKQIAKDPYDKELINRRNELLELQREQILAAEDEKSAIRDLVEEGINLELDALQEKIDLHNEELDSMKDLYDYQQKVKEQTEEIASLEKQMAAYENDDSEETKAKIQELKISLQDAETELKETEWDRYIDQQSQLLDTLYTEYELILNARLDNVDFLLQQVVDGINGASGALGSDGAIASALGSDGAIASALGAEGTLASALGVEGAIASAIVNAVGENGSVKKILNTEVSAVGTTLSTAMNNIWSVGEGNAKSVLTTYGQGFQDKQTITNDVLGNIKADVAAMVDDVDKDAQKKVETNKTQPSTKADPTKDNKKEEPKKEKPKKTSGDGKPKVGDKVKFVSGQYYYDSQGKKPLGYHNRGKEVYITSINTKSWATHPYHISTGNKLGKGDLGWLKLNQISGYATGKKDFANDEWAWTQEGRKQEYIIRPSDGAILTPVAKGDSVLNATASGNIWSMANNPAEFIKNNLGLDNANVPNGANVNNTYSQHIDNVVFRMDNVKNYDEMLSAMQKDKSFEKLILSMSINRLAGKSSLAKGKSIR